ncbi:MAG: hypothetical protein FVQ79_06775 [Planctomycetes bacterium]|nr:hypothetical protein [Planctomycetota bacterium]
MKTVSTACLIIILFAVTSLAEIKLPETIIKTYGNATVAKIIAVDNTYIFRCDVKGWPAIIGADIPIRINGIIEPVIVAEDRKPNRFFQMQAKKFLKAHLSDSKTITLENIKRGKDFSLIADVVTDSNSLADILTENGFARKLTEEEIKANCHSRESGNPDITISAEPFHAIKPANQRPVIKNTTASYYTASKNSKVFHESSCRFARSMSEKTALKFATKEQAINSGRRQCKICGK